MASNPSDLIRVAALDVGSNSVRLLVADARGGFVLPVFQDRVSCRLLSGLRDGLLDGDSIARTNRAIDDLSARAREMGARHIWAFGTSAMRDGGNRGLLMEHARALNVPLEVLSGEREAAISYRGAAPEGRVGVIDIGGGSTELLAGEGGRVLRAHSAQIGAVRLCERMGGRADECEMLDRARGAMDTSWRAVRGLAVNRWIGLGGTITNLAAMRLELREYDPDVIEQHRIDGGSAREWLHRLCATPLEDRRQIIGMNPARADIIPFGVAILCAFFDLSGAEAVFASDRDNLLGYLMEKLAQTLDKP